MGFGGSGRLLMFLLVHLGFDFAARLVARQAPAGGVLIEKPVRFHVLPRKVVAAAAKGRQSDRQRHERFRTAAFARESSESTRPGVHPVEHGGHSALSARTDGIKPIGIERWEGRDDNRQLAFRQGRFEGKTRPLSVNRGAGNACCSMAGWGPSAATPQRTRGTGDLRISNFKPSMNSDWRFVALAAGAVLAVAGGSARAQPAASKAPRVEVLSRGFVHEGFVAPITFDPAPGEVAPKAPPASLDERPPSVRPSGLRVIWLPGYWSWDAERRDFDWTSGGWRVPPPGMRWIAGYWAKTPNGFQWESGFWAPASAGQVVYGPLPPEYQESQRKADEVVPAKPAKANQFLVPGYWKPQGGDFVWRRAFWTHTKPGWVWTPAHYVWTPAGAVFMAGYWDYPLARRGLLFAPAPIERAAGDQAGFRFTPQAAINLTALATNLCVSAVSNQCCFGIDDSNGAAKRAVETRSAFEARGGGLVPIEPAAEDKTSNAGSLVLALSDLARSKATPLALVETDGAARRRAARAVEDALEIVARRRKVEAGAAKPPTEAEAVHARTLYLPKLPVELGGVEASNIQANAAELDELPGIEDRRTPGTKARDVPGLGGRVVPGVRDPLPGIGPLPGADNQR